jgi:Holliday junction resolvase RusA-like endonuclease
MVAPVTEFFLLGKVPSKKNSKMLTRGRLITKPEYQAMLKSLTLQAKAEWRSKDPLTLVDVDFLFHVSNRSQDIDNAVSGALDVLKDAGVIVDDSMMHVRRIYARYERVNKGNEGVLVRISG